MKKTALNCGGIEHKLQKALHEIEISKIGFMISDLLFAAILSNNILYSRQ